MGRVVDGRRRAGTGTNCVFFDLTQKKTGRLVQWGGAGWLVWACSFPAYVVGVGSVSGGASAGGESSNGGADGAKAGADGGKGTGSSAGGLGAGAAGDSAGAAGGPGNPGEIAPWSGPALDRFDFLLLGSARLEADGITLTRDQDVGSTGGIVQRFPVDLTQTPDLHVALRFRIESVGETGDGFAIVLHASSSGPSALGNGGGGLGYQKLMPCIAVELDTFTLGGDLPAPHLAIMSGCTPETHGKALLSLGGDPRTGGDWVLSLDFAAPTQVFEVRLRNVSTNEEVSMLDHIDLVTLLGPKAFVAVTGATGSFTSTQWVRSLQVEGGGVSLRTLTNDVSGAL